MVRISSGTQGTIAETLINYVMCETRARTTDGTETRARTTDGLSLWSRASASHVPEIALTVRYSEVWCSRSINTLYIESVALLLNSDSTMIC